VVITETFLLNKHTIKIPIKEKYLKAHFDRVVVIDTGGGHDGLVCLQSKRAREMHVKNIK